MLGMSRLRMAWLMAEQDMARFGFARPNKARIMARYCKAMRCMVW